MLDALSSALSGLSAATRRLEASANTVANSNAQSAPGDPAGRKANQPVRVEQTSAGGQGGTIATFRGTTPAYLAVFDPQAGNAGVDGFAAGPNVDLAGETAEQTNASADFEATAKVIQATSDLVKKLYDLV